MVNPCLKNLCGRRDKDKNHPMCLNCKDRLAYIGELGPMSASVPVYLTSLGGRKTDNGKHRKMIGKIKTCQTDGCEERAVAKGKCSKCYQKNRYRARVVLAAPKRKTGGRARKAHIPALKTTPESENQVALNPVVKPETTNHKSLNTHIISYLQNLARRHEIGIDRLALVLLTHVLVGL